MIETKHYKKPCIMHQDDEYGKNVLDGFTAQLAAMKVEPGAVTSYKRGASDFSAQVARMKADECDLVVLGTVIRETISAMTEAKKLGWAVDFLGATPTNVLEVPALGKDAVEELYAAAFFEIPYEDTATGKVKEWMTELQEDVQYGAEYASDYRLRRHRNVCVLCQLGRQGSDRAKAPGVIGSSGKEFHDIFGSPPAKFSPTDHLASTVFQVQQIHKGRWKVLREGVMF